MVFRTTPQLGPDVEQVVTAASGSSYDRVGSPQLGTTCMGSDGRLRMWVKASGTITKATAPGTQLAITVTGADNVTAAAGSGGWYAPPSTVYNADLLAGDRFWATKGTAP